MKQTKRILILLCKFSKYKLVLDACESYGFCAVGMVTFSQLMVEMNSCLTARRITSIPTIRNCNKQSSSPIGRIRRTNETPELISSVELRKSFGTLQFFLGFMIFLPHEFRQNSQIFWQKLIRPRPKNCGKPKGSAKKTSASLRLHKVKAGLPGAMTVDRRGAVATFMAVRRGLGVLSYPAKSVQRSVITTTNHN